MDEFIQTDLLVGSVVEERWNNLAQVSGNGPPDLIYLVYSSKRSRLGKLFTKSSYTARFFSILGNNLSSVSVAAAFFCQFSQMPDELLVQGLYCVFDLFNRRDLVVEVKIPGGTVVYSIGSDGQREEFHESTWKGAYLSSILRYFYRGNFPATYTIPPFQELTDLDLFFSTFAEFKDQIGVVLGDHSDSDSYGKHLLCHAMSRYLLKKRLYRIHSQEFRKMTTTDPLMAAFLVEQCWTQKNCNGSLKKLLTYCLEVINSAYLGYSLAKLHYIEGKYSESVALMKTVVSKHSEVFMFWQLLIASLIGKQEFTQALLCMNYALEQWQEPKIINHTKPIYFDYHPCHTVQICMTDVEMQAALEGLPAVHLSSKQTKLYSHLLDIVRFRDWNFLADERERVFTNISKNLRISVNCLTQSLPKPRDSVLIEKFQNELVSLESIDLSRIDYSEPGSPVITHSGAPIDLDLDTLLNHTQVPESLQLTLLIESLFKDLQQMLHWQQELTELEDHPDYKHKYSGEVWLMRGYLAERLKKFKVAEKAYRYTEYHGFSLFAEYRLLRLYSRTCNARAALKVCVQISRLVQSGDTVPEWLENSLAQLCSGCGWDQVFEACMATRAYKDPGIIQSLTKLKTWQVDGSC